MAADRGSSDTGRPNSLGLRARQLGVLLDRLDEEGGPPPAKRKFARWPFRVESVLLEVTHPGGSQVTFKVACRNISSGGISVLHSQYIHPASVCSVILPRGEGYARIKGSVQRCRHVAGVVHELGVQFDRAIDPRDFVPESVGRDRYTLEKVDPQSLEGRLVLFDPIELDQQIMRHFLKDTQLRLAVATTEEEMQHELGNGCDLLVVDQQGVGCDAVEWTGRLRDGGVHVPLLMVLPANAHSDRDAVLTNGADAALMKPLLQETVLRALAEVLCVTSLPASSKADSADAALASRFVDQLRKYAGELREHVKGDDAMGCYVICQQLKTGGQSLGFDRISRAAAKASDSIAQSMSVSESMSELRELMSACDRAAASASAA